MKTGRGAIFVMRNILVCHDPGAEAPVEGDADAAINGRSSTECRSPKCRLFHGADFSTNTDSSSNADQSRESLLKDVARW
jgi:hypothetical protein